MEPKPQKSNSKLTCKTTVKGNSVLSTKNEQAQATRNLETEFLWGKKPKQNSKPKQQIINKIAHHQKKKTPKHTLLNRTANIIL